MLKSSYDVIVVGGGPAGLTAARYASQKGASVLVLEKDRDIGYPVRCGEAVSVAGVKEFLEPNEKFIAAHITKFSMNAPNGSEVILPLEEEGLVLERRIFDYELAKIAGNCGTQILTRAYVNGLLFDNNKVTGVTFEHEGINKQVNSKIVVGADGVESRVGRWAGLNTFTDFRDMESCVQVTVGNLDIDQNACYFYLGSMFAPNGYLWIFPKGNRSANIGLGISGLIGKKKSANKYLEDFLQKYYPNASIMTKIAGGVPCATTYKNISAPGLVLVGDAAHQVNPLSGGGIISGMIGGKIAGNIISEALENNNLDHVLSYDKAWNDRLGKRHEIFDRIKNGIYNFDDDKFNDIAKAFNKVKLNERTLGNLFKVALFNKPSLLIDIAKVFFNR
ncbi:MAG TPA: NAD(P)/FAD-dependent oxidoreductase [Melioribacteraceae bacterium]|nr:NAD(P)/FAD-dependent oxidoreductase [Melioribacteraceae bacterium]